MSYAKKYFAAGLLVASSAVFAQTESASLAAIALSALEKGRVVAQLEGGALAYVQGTTGSQEPVTVVAEKIASLPEGKGCGRVRVTVKQERVPTLDGKLIPFVGGFDINLCPK